MLNLAEIRISCEGKSFAQSPPAIARGSRGGRDGLCAARASSSRAICGAERISARRARVGMPIAQNFPGSL
jgi:hypothetical protein